MGTELHKIPELNDIVFEGRNKNYGAYMLRKKYSRNLIISILTGIAIITSASIFIFVDDDSLKESGKYHERQVEIKMEKLNEPEEIVVPPPPPPPSPEITRQTKYVAPVIVDSVKSVEATQLMSMDNAVASVDDEGVAEYTEQAKGDAEDEKEKSEPFLVVQEMPQPQGGLPGLLKYISEHLVYPERAREYNIQGKVMVKFCVTETGNIDRLSILKGVNPDLDSAALHVVSTFPPFKPGKQAGKPVPVWYVVPINFQLN